MFAPRYFAPRYFAPRYFAPGVAVVTVSPDAYDVAALIATFYDNTLAGTATGLPYPGCTAAGCDYKAFTKPGGTRTEYYADKSYRTGPTDTPANQLFQSRLQSSFNVSSNLWSGPEPTGRGGAATAGAIDLRNGDGALDQIPILGWDLRDIELWTGKSDQAFTAFTKRFQGRTDDMDWDDRIVRIRARNKAAAFDRILQTTSYGGAGGLDGAADNAGKPIPACFGEPGLIEADLIDPIKYVYRWHSRGSEDLLSVQIDGVDIDPDTPLDVADVFASAPAAGFHNRTLGDSVFRLGSAPGGRVTCKVKGDNEGGYVSKTGDIAKRIVTEFMGTETLTTAQIDQTSINDFNTDEPGSVGYYTGSRPVAVARVISDLVGGAHGWWTMTALDVFTIGVLKLPTAPTATITERDLREKEVPRRLTPGQPVYRRRVRWGLNWVVLTVFGGSVTDADRAEYKEAERWEADEDASVRTKFAFATERDSHSFYTLKANATTKAAALKAVHDGRVDTYSLPLNQSRLWDFEDGQEITVDLARYGLDGGRDFVVKGRRIDKARGRLDLEIWGRA